MFKGLFSTETKTKPKTGQFSGLFAKQAEAKQDPEIKTFNFPDHLGGGQYSNVNTPRGYAGMPTKEGHERDHVFSVFAGGTSNPENLQYLPNDKRGRQAGKVDVENEAYRRYQAGEITLGQARREIATKQQEIQGLIPKQGTKNYLWEGFKGIFTETPRKAVEAVKEKARDIGSHKVDPVLQSKLKEQGFSDKEIKKELSAPNTFGNLSISFKKATDTAGELGKIALSALGNEYKTAAKELASMKREGYFGNKNNEEQRRLVIDTGKEFWNGLKKTGGVVGSIAQEIFRSGSGVALEVTGQENLKSEDYGPLSKIIGPKDVINSEKQGAEILSAIGASPSDIQRLALPAGLTMAALDFLPGSSATKKAITKITKLSDPAEILRELKTVFKNVPEKQLLALADSLVPVTSVTEANNIIKKLSARELLSADKAILNDEASAVAKRFAPDERQVMEEFTDAVNGAKKLGKEEKADLFEQAQKLAEDFRLPEAASGDKTLARRFAELLEEQRNEYKDLVKNIYGDQAGFAKMPESLIKAAESMAPLKHQDNITQKIFRDWTRSLLKGEERANSAIRVLPRVSDNYATILKYEQGAETGLSKAIKKEFDNLLGEARSRGLDVAKRENYLPQVYKESAEEVKTALARFMEEKGVDERMVELYLQGVKNLPENVSKTLKLNPSFIKERVFPDYKTAMQYGLTPRFKEPNQLLAHYINEMEKTIANRNFLSKLEATGKIAEVEKAGADWVALTMPFSPKGYYAPPQLAKMLNGMFRNEAALGLTDTLWKGAANLSKTMQQMVLSAGVPKTNINFFTIGQLVKNLTAGEFRAAAAFVRSNFDNASIKWFAKNSAYLDKMSNQGINILGRVDKYDQIYTKLGDVKGLTKQIGFAWNKIFEDKTFKSFMPQMQVQTFKGVYDKAIKKGMAPEVAEKLAGDTTKAFYGLFENLGRAKGTEDKLSALFFAPKFREGIIRTLFNTGLSVTTEVFNPAFSKNRKLVAGMLLTYAGYNALNHKLTGHYMWDNPGGKEFDLMIPTGLGNNGDDVIYIGFMPSFLAFARNLVSGGLALGKGDLDTAKQKFGSVFSMPIKTASEMWANKDYFGRQIYNENDDTKTKVKKLAKYAYLSVSHPFIRELQNQLTTDKPLYQSISESMELPLKFSSMTSIEKNEYYEAIRKMETAKAKEKKAFEPTYTRIKEMLEAGMIDQATSAVENLSDEEYAVYESFKRSDKSRMNIDQEVKVFRAFQQAQEALANNDMDSAQRIVDAMTDEEYAAYKRLKNKLK